MYVVALKKGVGFYSVEIIVLIIQNICIFQIMLML